MYNIKESWYRDIVSALKTVLRVSHCSNFEYRIKVNPQCWLKQGYKRVYHSVFSYITYKIEQFKYKLRKKSDAPRSNVSQKHSQRITAHCITVHTISVLFPYSSKTKFIIQYICSFNLINIYSTILQCNCILYGY